MFREGGWQADKRYLVLVSGRWMEKKRDVRLPLHKYLLDNGERRVRVAEDGKFSHTVFRLLARWERFSLLEAQLKTGRTHQIRVHLAHLGYPIAGDDKYGDFALNKALQSAGLKRMFLHAWKMDFPHPLKDERVALEAPLPDALAGGFSRGCLPMKRRIMAKRFDLLVFDWDGTLMDSAGAIVAAIQAACRDLGIAEPRNREPGMIGLGLGTPCVMRCPIYLSSVTRK